jgi:hypothetical protein
VAPRKAAKYRKDHPLGLDRISLSGELIILCDLLAENDHEVWAKEYMQNGWTVREKDDQI